MQDATIAKNSPFTHHRTNLSGDIFATKAPIDNWKKKLLNSNVSSTSSRYAELRRTNGWDLLASLWGCGRMHCRTWRTRLNRPMCLIATPTLTVTQIAEHFELNSALWAFHTIQPYSLSVEFSAWRYYHWNVHRKQCGCPDWKSRGIWCCLESGHPACNSAKPPIKLTLSLQIQDFNIVCIISLIIVVSIINLSLILHIYCVF